MRTPTHPFLMPVYYWTLLEILLAKEYYDWQLSYFGHTFPFHKQWHKYIFYLFRLNQCITFTTVWYDTANRVPSDEGDTGHVATTSGTISWGSVGDCCVNNNDGFVGCVTENGRSRRILIAVKSVPNLFNNWIADYHSILMITVYHTILSS